MKQNPEHLQTPSEGHFCVGIDIGTTTISAVVLDLTAGTAAESYTIANGSDIPSDRTWEKMQDPEIITARLIELTDLILKKYPAVKSIGITGQMHGILYVDESGSSVSPLYTWQDGRAGIGSPSPCDIIRQRTGYTVSPGYGLATHFALMLNGDIPVNAVGLCTIMDYAAMKLTGRTAPIMHSSNAASLGLYITSENRFDPDAVRRAGIDPAILPETTSAGVIAGKYRQIPVIAAIGDNQASFLGSVKNPERAALANFGTGSQISLMCRSPEGIPADAAMELRPYLETSWLASGSALCGGRAYALMERFFRQYAAACGLADTEQYEIMNTLAQKGIDSGNYLKVRTTFCGTRNDPDLTGSIPDITENLLTPDAMIAGVLWGMAAELHDMFLKMPHESTDTLVISGNAVRKNPALRQMLKQVFGMETALPIHKEEAAFGAAMFSALTADPDANPEVIRDCIRYSESD